MIATVVYLGEGKKAGIVSIEDKIGKMTLRKASGWVALDDDVSEGDSWEVPDGVEFTNVERVAKDDNGEVIMKDGKPLIFSWLVVA